MTEHDVTTPPTLPRTVADTLDTVSGKGWLEQSSRRVAVATGFPILDDVLAGGIRAGDLVLVGGQPGVGKTVLTLQWARHMAIQGHHVVYACYEHDEVELLGRLLMQELHEAAVMANEARVERSRAAVLQTLSGRRTLHEAGGDEVLVQRARRRMRGYGQRLSLLRGSGSRTDLGVLAHAVRDVPGTAEVLFVDYLQKVALQPEPSTEAEKVRRVTEGLKELALSDQVVVVAVSAADRRGLECSRVRLHHLRGSSALAYECDVALIMNDKFRSVSKAHLAYDLVRAETFKQQVVISVEKNRGGRGLVDLEFCKDFANSRLNPEGTFVAERLVDERLDDA